MNFFCSSLIRPLFYILSRNLEKCNRAVIWIIGAFCTFPTLEVEAIASLISTHLHLQKISRKYQIRMATLFSNHAISTLLENKYSKNTSPYCLSLKNMTSK